MQFTTSTTEKGSHTAVLVTLIKPQQSVKTTEAYLEELAFLAVTWGITTVATFTQKLASPNSSTFVGRGKVNEINEFIKKNSVGYAIFDDELSLSQVRNLEKVFSCMILDRSLLILNIFAMRAKTKQAKIQVALARCQYLLPRLTRMWSHLSRQQGSGGESGIRGPGEKELEIDRRLIKEKITLLNKKLKKIEQQSIIQSKTRKNIVRVSLVGYTNVGKSTLMTCLSQASVLVEDKLFATLDATVRKMHLNEVPLLLTDTVGFIRKLPHTLIECFKSTLLEIKEADILLHVIDVSHPTFEEQMKIVHDTLQEIGVVNVPMIIVLNKVDKIARLLDQQEIIPDTGILKGLQKYYLGAQNCHPVVFVSASKNFGIEALKELLYKKVLTRQTTLYLSFPAKGKKNIF